jgi:hypothetical protein
MSKYIPEDGCRNVWLKVTHDKYEFPVAVADTAAKLAELCDTTEGTIYSSISHMKHGQWSPYRKVRIEIDEDVM